MKFFAVFPVACIAMLALFQTPVFGSDDPSNFKATESEQCGLSPSDSCGDSTTLALKSLDEIKKMRLKDIRAQLEERGLSCSGCAEKQDYESLLFEKQSEPVKKAQDDKPSKPDNEKSQKSDDDLGPTVEELMDQLRAKGFGAESFNNKNFGGKRFSAEDLQNMSQEELKAKFSRGTGAPKNSGDSKKSKKSTKGETPKQDSKKPTEEESKDSPESKKKEKKDDKSKTSKENAKNSKVKPESNDKSDKKGKNNDNTKGKTDSGTASSKSDEPATGEKKSFFKKRSPPGASRKKDQGKSESKGKGSEKAKETGKGADPAEASETREEDASDFIEL